MKWWWTAALVLCAVASGRAHADSPVHVQARFRQSFALELDGARAQKLEVEALPRLEATLPFGFELTSIVRARADALDRIEPGRPDQSTYDPASERLLIGEVGELELREAYLERDFRLAYLTLGKQQVVWGKADGIKLLDVVDPQTFREFILPPFEESRIPLWTANLEIPLGPASAQLLWIPDTTVHDLPEEGAPFEIRSATLVPTQPPNVGVEIERARRPDDWISDSDAGVRLSGHVGGWDLTLNYLYHYDDVPLLVRSLRFDPTGITAVITPEYARTHVAGLSFATSWQDFTLRGEAAAFTDRYVSVNDLLDEDGLTKSEEYSWLLGLDWFGSDGGTFASVQIQQSHVPDLPDSAVRQSRQHVATLLVRRELFDASTLVQTMLLIDPERGDGLARGRLLYELSSSVSVAVGADVFFGDEDAIFGQFRDRTRLVVEIEESL